MIDKHFTYEIMAVFMDNIFNNIGTKHSQPLPFNLAKDSARRLSKQWPECTIFLIRKDEHQPHNPIILTRCFKDAQDVKPLPLPYERCVKEKRVKPECYIDWLRETQLWHIKVPVEGCMDYITFYCKTASYADKLAKYHSLKHTLRVTIKRDNKVARQYQCGQLIFDKRYDLKFNPGTDKEKAKRIIWNELPKR
ncbi:hypothetical protein [Endozoicomonas sp. ONNA1]|uniref:hypothetical protein n=1 Tax=Endozoicomonas sp. ONNA1 TaxID=2828740 RepID=UPI002148F624|nr:hypothetical protein [Endozoicomonas sp. ONNA1]